MSTFTDAQQKAARKAFIEENKQKAWNAACHAEWIGKGLDQVVAECEKMQKEDEKLAEEIKALEASVVSHTKENRDQRKALQERRNGIAKTILGLRQHHERGQAAMAQLYQNVETSLALAKHAETWEWKEAQSPKES
ncbi:MAG TPA: hypothetical protein VKW08_00265 [Xanthobacteraceae bacterium]|jgi:multidrug resistance efflux pump|nr:hypothetical protein [Xanthobacteraceae bacterium]